MALQMFTAFLDREPTDDELDLLYEAGFDDSSPELGNGVGMIHVTRHADTLTDAILSVVRDAEQAGFVVTGIEDGDLVMLKDIAERLGCTYESVRLLANGKRGPGGFPAPHGTDGWMFYSWTAVCDWLRRNNRGGGVADDRGRILSAANHLLRARALVGDLGDLAPLIRARVA